MTKEAMRSLKLASLQRLRVGMVGCDGSPETGDRYLLPILWELS